MLAPPRPRGGAPRAFINAYFARDALARGRKKKLPVASASTRSTRIDRASPRVARAPPPEDGPPPASPREQVARAIRSTRPASARLASARARATPSRAPRTRTPQICPFARPRVAPVRNPFIATLPFSTTHTPAVDRSSSRSPPHPRPGHITRADIAAACLALNLPGHDAAYVDELVAQFGGDAELGIRRGRFRSARRRVDRSDRTAPRGDDIATKAGAVTPGGVASPSPSPPSHPPRTMTSRGGVDGRAGRRRRHRDGGGRGGHDPVCLTRGGDDGSSKAALR